MHNQIAAAVLDLKQDVRDALSDLKDTIMLKVVDFLENDEVQQLLDDMIDKYLLFFLEHSHCSLEFYGGRAHAFIGMGMGNAAATIDDVDINLDENGAEDVENPTCAELQAQLASLDAFLAGLTRSRQQLLDAIERSEQ
jgi:hypothetical protein